MANTGTTALDTRNYQQVAALQATSKTFSLRSGALVHSAVSPFSYQVEGGYFFISKRQNLLMDFRDRNPLLLGVVAVCALGVGITGTLLWTQEHSSPSTTATPVSTTVKPTSLPPMMASESTASLPQTAQIPNAETLLTRANDAYDAQQWPKAVESYKQAISAGIDTPDVRTDFGNALRFAGQPKEALRQYEIAQSQDPTHEQSLFNQGGLWAFALHNPTKGVEAWRTYLKKFPKGHSAADARKFIKQNQIK